MRFDFYIWPKNKRNSNSIGHVESVRRIPCCSPTPGKPKFLVGGSKYKRQTWLLHHQYFIELAEIKHYVRIYIHEEHIKFLMWLLITWWWDNSLGPGRTARATITTLFGVPWISMMVCIFIGLTAAVDAALGFQVCLSAFLTSNQASFPAWRTCLTACFTALSSVFRSFSSAARWRWALAYKASSAFIASFQALLTSA